ncbi:zinc knuckle CX2CX4HX4C containing protein [Tanacetum coccineum]
MVVLTLDGPGYTKETIRVEYEWGPPRCSACLLFGHSVDDCPKASKRVVNRVDNSKVGSSGAVDDGFTEDLNGDNPVIEEKIPERVFPGRLSNEAAIELYSGMMRI